MKILWSSNSPMVDTGYGKQTRLFTEQMVKAGHDVTVFANFGHFGGVLHWNGLNILPASRDSYGKDGIVDHYQRLKPDVHVLLFDIWPFENSQLEAGHITAYAPVDHDTLPPLVEDRLLHTPYQWAMSRHAENHMKRAGLTPYYVPHMVDCATFQPMDRAKAREAVKVSDQSFLAVMVAAHKGYPMRKSFDRVFRAWAEFVRTRPDALLHVHTDPGPAAHNNHLDLEILARFYDIPPHTLRFPNNQRYHTGYFTDDYMNALFNASDVLVAPSMGEGFGVPVVEAQAAGCPVIVCDFTAQSELAGPGWKVPITPDDLFFSLQGAHYCLPRYSDIVRGLEWAYEQRGNEDLRAQSRAFALDYDAARVYPKYAAPALQAIGAASAERQARTEKRHALRKANQRDVA